MVIHEKKREALKAAILKGLEATTVWSEKWVDRQSLSGFAEADRIMAKHGDDQRALAEYVDSDHPISEIAFGFLSSMLASNIAGAAVIQTPLHACLNAVSLDSAAEMLISLVERLPLSYRVSIPLPPGFNCGYESVPLVPLNNMVSIRNASAVGFEAMPLTTHSDQFNDYVFNRFSNGPKMDDVWTGTYLELDVHGYISKGSATSPRLHAIDRLRSVIGLSMAMGVLVRKGIFNPTYPAHYYVHVLTSQTENQWFPVDKANLPQPTVSLLADLGTPHINSPEAYSEHIQKVHDCYWHIHATSDDSTDGKRLENASKWFFDAHASQDPLLSFVQMMVVLEILYGDKEVSEKIGLGQLLSNRCAYAIGKGSKDREIINREFKTIYDVRSQIVHRGKSRLSAFERDLFATLSGYCQRAISHEAALLRHDKAAQALGSESQNKEKLLL